MADKTKFWIDGIAATETPDIVGESLSISGADISELEAGQGRINDNHSGIMFGHLGRIVCGTKVMTPEQASLEPRHKYYWDKIKTPYIYIKGYLYNDEDHINSKAAIAILRNLYKDNNPLQIGASVEGAVLSRGVANKKFLEHCKIHSVALTFVPCNKQSLIEPMEVTKSLSLEEQKIDFELIQSVVHLAKTNVPSFRYVERAAQADKIVKKIEKLKELGNKLGIDNIDKIGNFDSKDLIKGSILHKINDKLIRLKELSKALSAGYGAMGSPTQLTSGGVLQEESQDKKKDKAKKDEFGFSSIVCPKCGNGQIYFPRQVKCRECGVAFPFSVLLDYFINN